MATRALGLGLMALAAASCAPSPDDAPEAGDGEVSFDLSVTPGMAVQTATYSLSGPAGFARTETLDVSSSTNFSISGVPAGDGYTVHLSASSRDGKATCTAASASFQVGPRATTAMFIHLSCAPSAPWVDWPVPPVNSAPRSADPVTSLMWAVSSVGGPVSRTAADSYCAGINEGGYEDWRLPTVIELLSVVDFSVTGGVFHVTAGPYSVYSSTPVAGSSDLFWSVSWYDGSPVSNGQSAGAVLCVRNGTAGGASSGRFSYAPDGMVAQDIGTHLVWQRTPPAQALSLADARAYCGSAAVSDALGGSGWRLPNVKELWTLVDFSCSSAPAIDGAAFPDTAGDLFWTTTDYADGPPSGPISAWAVDFSSGQGSPVRFAEAHDVRCVR